MSKYSYNVKKMRHQTLFIDSYEAPENGKGMTGFILAFVIVAIACMALTVISLDPPKPANQPTEMTSMTFPFNMEK